MYVKDVNMLLHNKCKILREAHVLSPDTKLVHCWIVSMSGSHLCWTISGSLRTCWKEQLSFLCSSGCDQGNARKGWCCLCAIFVENAGSMQERHYLALCKLLGLEVKKQEERVSDPSSSFPVSPVDGCSFEISLASSLLILRSPCHLKMRFHS